MYCAFSTLRGSSIGVGKLWPEYKRRDNCNLEKGQFNFQRLITNGDYVLDNKICPILLVCRRCSDGKLLGRLREAEREPIVVLTAILEPGRYNVKSLEIIT